MQCRGCRMVPGQREPPRNSPARLDRRLSARPSTRGCNRDGRQPLLSARPRAVCSACVVLGTRVQPPPARHQAPARKGPRRVVWGRRRSPGCRGGGSWGGLAASGPFWLGFLQHHLDVPWSPAARRSRPLPAPGRALGPHPRGLLMLRSGWGVWEDRDPSPAAAGGLPTSLPRPLARRLTGGRTGPSRRSGGCWGRPSPLPASLQPRRERPCGPSPRPCRRPPRLGDAGWGAKGRHP